MQILVTGCAGTIGTSLCLTLLRQGHVVIGVDNFLSGSRDNTGLLLRQYPTTFFLIQADAQTLRADDVKACIGKLPITQIYHLASPASPPLFLQYPRETIDVNTRGTQHLLDLAKKWDARFLFASTSEIYGNPTVHPQPETYTGNVNPTGPRSVYDEAKRLGETITMLAHRNGQDTRIVRIFNTYGPYNSLTDGRVVPNFITQALQNAPLTLYGDGMQTRSLCYVDDTVAGLLGVMASAEWTPFNVGNPHEVTMVQLAKVIKKLVPGCTSKLSYHPLPVDDPERRKPDISKIKGRIGWEPQVQLATGLSRVIEVFRERLDRQAKTAVAFPLTWTSGVITTGTFTTSTPNHIILDGNFPSTK